MLDPTQRAIDQYFQSQEEPNRGTLLALRSLIRAYDSEITEAWKYKMPFFCFRNRMLCYLWIHKKYKQPYLGIVDGSVIDHPGLLTEKRARMKVLLIDPKKNIPIKLVHGILKKIIEHRKGERRK